jgi:hypothetical protein
MHAKEIVQRFFALRGLQSIHAARRPTFVATVLAAMRGHWLSVTRLARGLIEDGGCKAAIKRVDRLIGNARIADEAQVIGAALLAQLIPMQVPLVIAVDWSAVSPGGRFAELRAAVTWSGMGRGLTVYQCVYPQRQQGSRKAESKLLQCLWTLIPKGTRVIVVTDAGFRLPWFKHIERLGWAWIGRIRGKTNLEHAGVCARISTWFGQATSKAKRLIGCALTNDRLACDAVLFRRGKTHRKFYRCAGYGPTARVTQDARHSAREPWLLAHSSDLRYHRADEIVAFYARRMQIEENFRDAKSANYGMGLEVSRSRSALRLHALLLIATLATYLLWHIGQVAEAEGLQRRFKATTREAREFSIISLALLLISTHVRLPLTPEGAHTLCRRLRMAT